MKKNITVIMKETSKVKDPLRRIQKVSVGYAFNYLIPKQIAELTTKGKIKHLNMLHKKISESEHLVYDRNIKMKRKLESIDTIRIRKKCSPSKLIFGSISDQDVLIKIIQLTGQAIEKKQIAVMADKKLGKHKIEITIEEKIKAAIDLHILPKTI